MERRKIQLIAIFTFLFFSISFAGECSKYFLTKDYSFFIDAVKSYKTQLGISIQQLDQINSIIDQYEPQIKERKDKITEIEDKINEILINGGSSEKLKQLIIQLARLKTENTVLQIREIREIQNILTDEQYRTLLKILFNID